MLIKNLKLSYFRYSIIMAFILSALTLIVTLISPKIDYRLVYLIFYYFFFNFSVLLGISFLANLKQEQINLKSKKIIFLFSTTFYFVFYILSSLSFLSIGQTIKAQGILFIYVINPFFFIVLILVGILIALSILTYLIHIKIHLYESEKEAKKIKKYLILSLVGLAACLFLIYPNINSKNHIVENYNNGEVIYFEPEILSSQNLINEKINLTDKNVIFILLESVSPEKITYYGNPRNITPNIDSLASNGLVFKNAYTTATHSDYAQPSYLSSRYVLANDYRNFFDKQINKNFIWDIFKDLNYTTYYFSSQDESWAGMNKYFNYDSLDFYSYSLTDNETDYGTGFGKKDYDYKTIDSLLSTLNQTIKSCEEVNISNQVNCTNEYTNPFFIYINLQATHMPLIYPEEYEIYITNNNSMNSTQKVINRYDNSLFYVDYQIGRVLDYLNEIEEYNNTIIVLSADHGHDLLGIHEFADHGLTLYDDELTVPLIISSTELKNRNITKRTSHIDVIPTFLELMNIETNRSFEGNLMTEKERFFFYTQNNMYLIGMIKEDIKVIVDLNRNLYEVYNLTIDPGELKDLSREKRFDKYLLELLMWHHCQLEYFHQEEKNKELEFYCERYYI